MLNDIKSFMFVSNLASLFDSGTIKNAGSECSALDKVDAELPFADLKDSYSGSLIFAA